MPIRRIRRFRRRPGRTNRRRFNRRVRTYRRHTRNTPTTLITRQLGGFPDRAFVKLKCMYQNTVSFDSSGIQQIQLLLNSNSPVGGQNYTGFANWCYNLSPDGLNQTSPYQRYLLHGVKIKVTAVSTASASGQLIPFYGLFPLAYGESNYSGAVTGLLEMPGVTHRYIQTNSATTNNQLQFGGIKKYVSMRRYFNIKNLRDQANLYAGDYATPPTDLCSYDLFFATDRTGSTDAGLKITYQIEFTGYFEFFLRNTLWTANS